MSELRGSYDFDLHGIVGLRLVDAAPDDVRAVRRQLGPIERSLDRAPDLVVRFVDRLEMRGTLRLLGLDAASSDDAFFVLRGKYKSQVRVQIPFAEIGGLCEIVCERGLPAVPLLVPMLNLTALAHGAVPVHASAFEWQGIGVLCTGWSKGGKTEALLAFMAQGARYIGDEWVVLQPERMAGIPEPMHVWDWHLESMPQYRALLSTRKRWWLRGVRSAARSCRRWGGTRAHGPRSWLRRSAPLLEKQLHVRFSPDALFGAERCMLIGRPDRIVFVGSHEDPACTVTAFDPGEVARRMVHSLQEEMSDLLHYYRQFRFAFPSLQNSWIERSAELQRTALDRCLENKPTLQLLHPYPVSIPALFDALSPQLLA